MKLTEVAVKNKLAEVLDPELNISIVDLGLVYSVKIKKDETIHITMTLTTIGCPLFSLIEQEVKQKLKEMKIDEKRLRLELTFDPPWNMEMMSERAKAMLGI